MDITGTLKQISKTQQVSDKFSKREFVLTDDSSQYPQHILFQLTQDKCGLLDKHKVGSKITVHFNLRGREWTSPYKNEIKYFNTLEAWRIEGEANGTPAENKKSKPSEEEQVFGGDGSSDLPF